MSADFIDDASDREQEERDRAIAEIRLKAVSRPTIYYSHCCWCGDPSPDGKEFCSYGHESCATDARRHEAVIGRNRGRAQ